jgi:CRP-like cAMP-binding protein
MRLLDLKEGAVVWSAGRTPEKVYFPRSGMISIRVPTEDSREIEVGTVGHEGAVGLQDRGLFGATTRAVIEIPGQFSCISKADFTALARESEELRDLASSCDAWLLLQAQQIAACNAVHSADSRFCRWLLRAADATSNDTVLATQEVIAQALGLRRTTATLIAQRLQSAGMISYSRGCITIHDRAGLEAAACRCSDALQSRNWPSEQLRAAPFLGGEFSAQAVEQGV